MKSKKSNDSRQYILDKSKNVFIRKGFVNVSMKDIAEECNISIGGLNRHFSSVAEIFADISEQYCIRCILMIQLSCIKNCHIMWCRFYGGVGLID